MSDAWGHDAVFPDPRQNEAWWRNGTCCRWKSVPPSQGSLTLRLPSFPPHLPPGRREALNYMSDGTCPLERHKQPLSPASSTQHSSSELPSQRCAMSSEDEAGSQSLSHKGQGKHSSVVPLASIFVSLAGVTDSQLCPNSYNLKRQASIN